MGNVPGYRDVPPEPWDPTAPVDSGEAEDFLRMCYAENPKLGPVEPRLAVVRAQIAATGTYVHTPDELAYGARVAWRNSSRCIGRLYWRSLVVLDRRRARTAEEIFALIVRHLCMAGGTASANREPGAIRPVVSIFPQAHPGRPFARIWNEQLIRYAGYRQPDGSVVGDPRAVGFTESMRDLGWRGKGDAFDVLPVAIETPEQGVRLFDLPERAVLEVPLAHPEYGWFAELGLRWHAVPAISNMRLTIGGVHYPLAPFNGWYMGTEIGARNLADPDRYNMVPVVARMLGLDTSKPRTLWRDRALVEINRAVLWSFERAGVKITDHHTESDRFLAHVRNETRAGREVPADWTWIVPPLSGGATGVFHRYYHEADLRPNFYLDAEARALAAHGHHARTLPTSPVPDAPPGCPVHAAPSTTSPSTARADANEPGPAAGPATRVAPPQRTAIPLSAGPVGAASATEPPTGIHATTAGNTATPADAVPAVGAVPTVSAVPAVGTVPADRRVPEVSAVPAMPEADGGSSSAMSGTAGSHARGAAAIPTQPRPGDAAPVPPAAPSRVVPTPVIRPSCPVHLS